MIIGVNRKNLVLEKDMAKLSTQMNTHIQELKLQMMENSLNKFGQNKYREITISILNSIKQYFMG